MHFIAKLFLNSKSESKKEIISICYLQWNIFAFQKFLNSMLNLRLFCGHFLFMYSPIFNCLEVINVITDAMHVFVPAQTHFDNQWSAKLVTPPISAYTVAFICKYVFSIAAKLWNANELPAGGPAIHLSHCPDETVTLSFPWRWSQFSSSVTRYFVRSLINTWHKQETNWIRAVPIREVPLLQLPTPRSVTGGTHTCNSIIIIYVNYRL